MGSNFRIPGMKSAVIGNYPAFAEVNLWSLRWEIGEIVSCSSCHYMRPRTFLTGSIETHPLYPDKVSSNSGGSKHVIISKCHSLMALWNQSGEAYKVSHHSHDDDAKYKKTPWSVSASELYRPSDHRLSAKWLPNFCGYRVPCGQRDGSLRPYSRFSRQEPLLFYQVTPQLYSWCRVDPVPDPLLFFLVVPGIEPGPLDL
jgi:hypothetical protein